MFSNPTMLDDLDFLYKSDTARKLMFYYQASRLFEDFEASWLLLFGFFFRMRLS